MIRQSIGTALGLSIYAVLFLLLANSPAVQEPSRGNEWGQLNQPRRSLALMVSAKWLNTLNQWGSIHGLASMASLLSVLTVKVHTVSITWEIRQWLAQRAIHPVISMTGWLSVKLFIPATNYRGITEACALEARAETLDQPKCFSIAIQWQLKDQTEIKSTSGLMMNQWPYLMHT